MKLLVFLIFLLLPAALEARQLLPQRAEDIDRVPLLNPDPYDPDKGTNVGRFVKSLISGGFVWVGGSVEGVRKATKARMLANKADLEEYFPDWKELDSFIDKTIDLAKNEHFKRGVDDASARYANEFIGERLLTFIGERILEKQGVQDPARRRYWMYRINKPFMDCSIKSQDYFFEADGCLTSVQTAYVQNLAQAVVHEIVRGKFAPLIADDFQRTSFIHQQDNAYAACVGNKENGKLKAKKCAVKTIHESLQIVTRSKLEQQIIANIGRDEVGAVRDAVWPKFTGCLQKIEDMPGKPNLEKEIVGCIDDLAANTGGEIVLRRVMQTPAVVAILPDPAKRRALAERQVLQFRECVASARIQGIRNKDGLIDTSRCEERVKNAVTYDVVTTQFEESAVSNLGPKHPQLTVVQAEGKKFLDSCWSMGMPEPKREKCLRDSIVKFSGAIASRRLDKEVPPGLAKAQPKLKAELVGGLIGCLSKELPVSITTATDLGAKIDLCTAPLVRRTALIVADFKLRDSLQARLGKEELDRLTRKLVQQDFASCLGSAPDGQKLDLCTVKLKAEAVRLSGARIFPKELADYFAKQGGIASFGLELQDLQAISQRVTGVHEACVDKEFANTDAKAADALVDLCYKRSIRAFVAEVSALEFKKAVDPLYAKHPDKLELRRAEFSKRMMDCVDAKSAAKFPLDDYLANIYSCADQVAHRTTLSVAPEQVGAAIDENLQDTPEQDNSAKRAELKRVLIADYERCMSALKPSESKARERCIAGLQKESTRRIVIAVGGGHLRKQLGTDRAPASVKSVEAAFQACVDKVPLQTQMGPPLDKCMADYSIQLAKALAVTKLNFTLGGALGTKEMQAQKAEFDRLLAAYGVCLDKLDKAAAGEEFFAGISACAVKLEADATGLVVKKVRDWAGAERRSEPTAELKALFALAIPCLDRLMPSTPYSEEALAKVDAEGSLQALAKLIGAYIDYDLEHSKQTVPQLLEGLLDDIEKVGPAEARRRLLDYLRSSGALDRLLKAAFMQRVGEMFQNLPPEEQIPANLRARLLKKENFDNIFAGAEGDKIRDFVYNRILVPTLIEGKSGDSKELTEANEELARMGGKALLYSPYFGEILLTGGVQQKMDSMNWFKRILGRLIYGPQAVNWAVARKSEMGKIAEEYILECLMKPKFVGGTVDPAEMKRREAIAAELATAAGMNQSLPKPASCSAHPAAQ